MAVITKETSLNYHHLEWDSWKISNCSHQTT